MPIARFALVALDCRDPALLAEFYRQLAGGSVLTDTASDDWVRLETGTGADIGFQRDPGYTPPTWPDGGDLQAHLDFDVEDLDGAEAAVIEIGARKTDVQPAPDSWRVFLDPAGHPFCLVKA